MHCRVQCVCWRIESTGRWLEANSKSDWILQYGTEFQQEWSRRLQHCSHTVLLRSPHADSIDKKLVVCIATQYC